MFVLLFHKIRNISKDYIKKKKFGHLPEIAKDNEEDYRQENEQKIIITTRKESRLFFKPIKWTEVGKKVVGIFRHPFCRTTTNSFRSLGYIPSLGMIDCIKMSPNLNM